MLAPTKLSDYPWVVVRIECVLCPRRGSYRLARLAARYGPEQSLDGLLADLANDCPYWRTNPRKYDPRCGARYADIERNLPPHDLPETAHRKRAPQREDMPKQGTSPALSGATPMLSNWPSNRIALVCDKCSRNDVYEVSRLLGFGDARLTDLSAGLSQDCPRRKAASIYDLCGARLAVPE